MANLAYLVWYVVQHICIHIQWFLKEVHDIIIYINGSFWVDGDRNICLHYHRDEPEKYLDLVNFSVRGKRQHRALNNQNKNDTKALPFLQIIMKMLT